MFAAFFAAVRDLTANARALADSFREANERLRGNLLLDAPAEAPAPQLTVSEETNKGRKQKGV
jgi:hypothetical protein